MLGILSFPYRFTDYEAKGEWWAQMCGIPALCSETKVCVLFVCLSPHRRMCLVLTLTSLLQRLLSTTKFKFIF